MSDIDTTTTDIPEICSDLRALAVWLEDKPTLACRLAHALRFLGAFPQDDDEWQTCLRELGSFDKSAQYGYLTAKKRLSRNVHIEVHRSQEATCQKVQVGEREVTVEVPVDPDAVIETRTETRTEPVYEWVCPDEWVQR